MAVIVLAMTPGQDFAMILARGIGEGRRVALFTVIGFALAGFIQVPALATGLAPLLEASPWVFFGVKVAGAAYLVFLGIQMARSSSKTNFGAKNSNRPIRDKPITDPIQALRDGFVASLLNPKAFLFIFAFLPQFVDRSRDDKVQQILVLGFLMKSIVFAIESVFAVASGTIGGWFYRNPKWARRQHYFTAAVLGAIGLSIFATL